MTTRIYCKNTDDQVARALADARAGCRMTQQQLSEQTGIAQADISRLENGKGNPTLNSLRRLAGGMDCQLEVRFAPKEASE